MLENRLFVLDCYEKQIQVCIAGTKTQAMHDAELWHARFVHVGYGSLKTLQRHNMVYDLSLLEMPPRHVCEGCILGKMHKFVFLQDGSIRGTRKLQLVHSDVCGPMRTPFVKNNFYFVTFVDDFSRFCWVYPLKAKSNVFANFQHYVAMVENETGCKVQTLRTDRGGEYISGTFRDFLVKKGIKHQCTMPYTPQQNGVAERKNKSLREMTRCMLKAKSLPHKLWIEAVACVAHVLNRCPTRALKTITPFEAWYDKKPSISYLRVFGCLAYAHIPQQLCGKLDDKAVKCIFVGYSSGSKGMLENRLFVLDCYEKQIQVCIAGTKTQAMHDAELWHARFVHVGYGSLKTLQRHNMVYDLSLLEMPPRHVCEGCILGKMHKFVFLQDGSIRGTRKLQLVHSDVCGPMRTPFVKNNFYFVTFVDDFSRFCWVYPLKAKSNVFANSQHYVAMVENETGCKVQTLRTDRGGEYISGTFRDFLVKKGIKHQCTMPYTPQQNGVAERKNKSLREMTRCMLKAKNLPHKLWIEAVACVAHVLNRCPTRALKTITPFEAWYDKKPSISYLRVFGCLAYAHIPQQLCGKLDDKAVKCIFVGYSSGSKGYRLYTPATNNFQKS
ncbi:hypothetical protein L7F22_036263 [Adiantum nelumboides]|nr:hypothetical protein [Adiantum nelumboides]